MIDQPSPSPRKSWWTWIRISEVVGVIAVVIAILNFWDNHLDRRMAESARQAAEQRAATAPAFVLVGVAEPDGGRIRLSPVHPDQPIQSQVFTFPAEIRKDPVQITGAARIEAGWLADGLRRAAGKADPDAGDRRAPVGVTTTYLADGDTRTDVAVYMIGYRLEPRFLRPAKVILEGLSVARRNVRGDIAAATEQAWQGR